MLSVSKLCRKWFSVTLNELEELLKREDSGQYLALYSTSTSFIFDEVNEVCCTSLRGLFNLAFHYMPLNPPLPPSPSRLL